MDDKLKDKIVIILLTLIIIGTCSYFLIKKFILNKNNGSEDSVEITSYAKSQIDDINWDNYEGNEITLTKSIKITKGGVYTLTGEIKDGLILIDTDDNVKLILNNVSVTNTLGPAIYVANADNVEIETLKGTINTFTDGSSYNFDDEDANATIFSHDDLI